MQKRNQAHLNALRTKFTYFNNSSASFGVIFIKADIPVLGKQNLGLFTCGINCFTKGFCHTHKIIIFGSNIDTYTINFYLITIIRALDDNLGRSVIRQAENSER